MNKLEIKIPWWYKLFIGFMPNFWVDLPKEKHGNYQINLVSVRLFYAIDGKPLGNYNSLQYAYLKVRWKAMCKDFWTYNYGIQWKIVKLTENI